MSSADYKLLEAQTRVPGWGDMAHPGNVWHARRCGSGGNMEITVTDGLDNQWWSYTPLPGVEAATDADVILRDAGWPAVPGAYWRDDDDCHVKAVKPASPELEAQWRERLRLSDL